MHELQMLLEQGPLALVVGLVIGLLLGLLLARALWVRPLRERYEEAEDERRMLAGERIRLVERLDAQERNHAERLQELEDRFANIAGQIFKQNSESFLQLASERFETHKVEAARSLEQRKQEIESLVKPLSQTLEKFEQQVSRIEKARQEAYGAIQQQVRALIQGQKELSDHTGRLVQALRQPKTRGRWGEFQLRNVLELAGMQEHVDFVSERTLESDQGRLRPDVIIRMPGGKCLVVDAKTPLDAYLRMLEAADEGERQQALREHVRQVREHARKLAAKEYWQQLSEAPDFVVMFIPGEAFYAAAVEADPSLFEDALKQRVLITTPTTFIALVRAIAYGWQQDKLARNLQEVADQGRILYDRITQFGEHLEQLGRSLRQAVTRFNQAVGSLESRLLPAARRFENLGVAPQDREIAAPDPIETEPRALKASEFAQLPGKE